ncbi:protein far1-related sequence 5-like [Gigaspora margarita]|uniref:Protein far1-related sequence 5-like n=1 Tax=Gigaspora margarita TaxID=4874 RepID=A0A8H3XDV6_GIGMA|nr:protein far1-related sequence 5-like [Gigaspora margarita]
MHNSLSKQDFESEWRLLISRYPRAEIAEALWYSAKLVSKESINISLPQEQSEVNFYKNLDDFLATIVNDIISSLPTLSIQEIWETTRYRASYKNYIIILNNGNHICICLRLINQGLLCYHFTRIMTISQIAAFHILIISRRWYLDEHYSKSDELLISQPSITYKDGIVNTDSNEIQNNESSESSDLDNNQENVTLFDVSTIQDLAVKKRKGAPRVKRIKNSLDTKNIQSSNKKKKATCLCFRCKQPNHYAKTCAIDP